jgi:uncharacterized membrane protein HdeD (DUF308 family)
MATDTLSAQISKQTGWSIFMGVLTAVVGLVMIAYPFATATVTAAFLGWALLIASFAQLMFAFSSQTAGNFFAKLLLAVLYGIAGLALAGFPIAGAVSLTAVLGALLITEAIFEMVIAFSVPAGEGRGWFVLSSLTSLLAGVMILAAWPSSTTWAIGTLVGVAVLINGITRVVVSSQIRIAAKSFARTAAA